MVDQNMKKCNTCRYTITHVYQKAAPIHHWLYIAPQSIIDHTLWRFSIVHNTAMQCLTRPTLYQHNTAKSANTASVLNFSHEKWCPNCGTLQLNYWGGPIDGWAPLAKYWGGPGPRAPRDWRPWLHTFQEKCNQSSLLVLKFGSKAPASFLSPWRGIDVKYSIIRRMSPKTLRSKAVSIQHGIFQKVIAIFAFENDT